MQDIQPAAASGKSPAVPSGVEWALYAGALGWPVFPIRPGTKQPYAGVSTAAALGLNPDDPAGVYHARSDEASIRALWSDDRAGAMVGLAMGRGRLAIDQDEKNGKSGAATMAANAWTIPATAAQRTPSGGAHYVVNVPPALSAPTDTDFGDGIDRRGEGGYIALYDPAMLTATIADAPEWSLAAASAGNGERFRQGAGMRAPSYAIALQALQAREPDMDRAEWLLLSGAFHTATVGLVDDAQARSDWQAWNVAYGDANDPADNARTWAGFARSGTKGDFGTLARLSGDSQALAWHFFKGDHPAFGVRRIVRPANDANNLFVRIADMVAQPPIFLVDGLIETDALAVLFGDPGSGKSLVAIDMAASIATGHSFHGRAVRSGSVFYIAGEGKNGLRRRFAAWEEHTGQTLYDAALYASKAAVQFLDSASAAMVTAAIELLAATHGPPRLIVIDTLARNFGGGDENSQKDMNAFVAALDQLRERFPGSTVLLVHHSGHGDKERARGSSVLRGAVDAEYKVAKVNEAVHLTNHKMKDAAPPPAMAFDLIEAGGHVALEYTGEPNDRTGKMSRSQALALQAFDQAAVDGRASIETWRAEFYALHTGSDAAKRKAFARSRDSLIEAGILQSDDSDSFVRVPMPGMTSSRKEGLPLQTSH